MPGCEDTSASGTPDDPCRTGRGLARPHAGAVRRSSMAQPFKNRRPPRRPGAVQREATKAVENDLAVDGLCGPGQFAKPWYRRSSTPRRSPPRIRSPGAPARPSRSAAIRTVLSSVCWFQTHRLRLVASLVIGHGDCRAGAEALAGLPAVIPAGTTHLLDRRITSAANRASSNLVKSGGGSRLLSSQTRAEPAMHRSPLRSRRRRRLS